MDSLALIYGDQTLVLHGHGAQPPVKGARRLSAAPKPEKDGTCTEIIEVVLEGSPAGIADLLSALETCLVCAEHRIDPVVLALAVGGGSAPWQSPVLGGRVEFLDAGSSDRLHGAQTIKLLLTRMDYWEGVELSAPLSNHNGSGVTSGLQIENHQDDDHQNYVDVDAGNLSGDLPAPCRLEMQHVETSPERHITDLWMGFYLDSNHQPPQVILEGEEANTAPGSSVITNPLASGGFHRRISWETAGEVELCCWMLPSSLLQALAGRTLMPLVRFASPPSPANLWLQLRVNTGWGMPTHQTEWMLLKPGIGLQELPAVALPPWSLPGDGEPAPLSFSIHGTRSTAGACTLDLDFVQLTPTDCWRKFTSVVPLAYGSSLVDDLPRRLCYTTSLAGEMATHTAAGEPLIIWRGRKQRIYILHSPGEMYIDTRMQVKVAYRPRRRVL